MQDFRVLAVFDFLGVWCGGSCVCMVKRFGFVVGFDPLG